MVRLRCEPGKNKDNNNFWKPVVDQECTTLEVGHRIVYKHSISNEETRFVVQFSWGAQYWSLRRLSALHSTFFSLWKTLVLVVVVVVAVVCTLHVVVFPSFFHLIILSLLTAYKGGKKKQQKGI